MATKTHIVQQEEGQVERTVQVRSADPGSPVTNQVWINTTAGELRRYNGATTDVIGGSPSGLKMQKKFLSADVAVDTVSIASLTFNALEIGKVYRLVCSTVMEHNPLSAGGSLFEAKHNGGTILTIQHDADSSDSLGIFLLHRDTAFTAAATTVTFNISNIAATRILRGNGTETKTWVRLEELPGASFTTDWT